MHKPKKREWTLMFYFASDNPLAPGIVSQLKAIKQGGFHPDANVIAQFDPRSVGTPTHIFEVNLVNKLKAHGKANIGFRGNDPFVRSLMEDKLWKDQKTRTGALVRTELQKSLKKENVQYDPPIPPETIIAGKSATNGSNEPGPEKSLSSFLKFCCDNYPARNYMLFILGHGLVVGNDVFLFDEHADEHSLSLSGLGRILHSFKKRVEKQKAQFQLVSFHSCSVSSLEVAYQLKGTANYMLASQGPAFVGSWPYRQILIRVFNDLERKKPGQEKDVKALASRIFDYCLHNSADFLLAGYSFDLCLCNLNKVADIKEPLKELSNALVDGLADSLVKDLIQLAHLKSQSYWQESYTDLYDFCLCLINHCDHFEQSAGRAMKKMEAIRNACGEVIKILEKESSKKDDKLIVRSEFAGPAYQYSHGLSVFFPWSEPSSDSPIMDEYPHYKFTETRWTRFLGIHASTEKSASAPDGYFQKTMRETLNEERAKALGALPRTSPKDRLFEDIASLVYNDEGRLSRSNSLSAGSTLSGPGKVGPTDPTGDDCTCASIKNFPHDVRARVDKGRKAGETKESLPMSPAVKSRFLTGA